jgi:hypothetical protein
LSSFQVVVFADQKATLPLLKQLGPVEVVSVR